MTHAYTILLIILGSLGSTAVEVPVAGGLHQVGPEPGSLEDPLEALDVAGLVEELRDFRSVVEANSKQLRDSTRNTRERLDRGSLAMRAAAVGRVLECRIPLLEIVAACEHPATEPIALDALAALRYLGEPEPYFMDLLARAPNAPHLAAGAMMVLAWDPSDELVEAATAATQSCLGIDEKYIAHGIMTRALGQVRMANGMRHGVEGMILRGERSRADRLLLGQLMRMYYKPSPDGGPATAGRLYQPASVYARDQLWQRADEDVTGLRASLESMTVADFLGEEPDDSRFDEVKRLQIFREQVLTLLPETVRAAGAADPSER